MQKKNDNSVKNTKKQRMFKENTSDIATGESNRKRNAIYGMVIALAAVILSLAVTLCLKYVTPKYSNSAENTAISYIEAINNRDFDGMLECMLPDYADSVSSYAMTLGSGDAFMDSTFEGISANSAIDFGDNVTISISDTSEEEQTITDGKFNGQDISNLNVSAVTAVYATVTTKGDLSESSENVEFVVMKIKNHWYIYTMATAEKPTVASADTSAAASWQRIDPSDAVIPSNAGTSAEVSQ